jgi:hypothetical protein
MELPLLAAGPEKNRINAAGLVLLARQCRVVGYQQGRRC